MKDCGGQARSQGMKLWNPKMEKRPQKVKDDRNMEHMLRKIQARWNQIKRKFHGPQPAQS